MSSRRSGEEMWMTWQLVLVQVQAGQGTDSVARVQEGGPAHPRRRG